MDVKERTIREARSWFLDRVPVLDTRTPLQRGIDRVWGARENVFEQDRSFWIAFSFGIGLATAGIVTFFWWQRRFQQQEDETLIQLPSDQEGLVGDVGDARVGGTIVAVGADATEEVLQEGDAAAEDTQDEDTVSTETLVANALTNATFVGVVDTKRYYPLETPLDQLTAENGEVADVVYFTSEEDAQSQGYVLASRE